jgi:hypothetical protein
VELLENPGIYNEKLTAKIVFECRRRIALQVRICRATPYVTSTVALEPLKQDIGCSRLIDGIGDNVGWLALHKRRVSTRKLRSLSKGQSYQVLPQCTSDP